MKAFPKTPFVDFGTPQNGMDLRDYFAAKALQALIPVTTKAIADELITSKNVVNASYQWADAMLSARGE